MVYLLKSAEFAKLENGETEFFFSLKIGYTEDENTTIKTNKRLYTYFVSNRSIELLYTIPFGTEELERELHERFKEFRWDNSDEWYIYDQSIVDYFHDASKFNWPSLNKIKDIFNKFTLEDSDCYFKDASDVLGDKIYDEKSVLNYLLEESKTDNFINKTGVEYYLDYINGTCIVNPEIEKKIRGFVNRINKLSTYSSKINAIRENKDKLSQNELDLSAYFLDYKLFEYISYTGIFELKVLRDCTCSANDIINETKEKLKNGEIEDTYADLFKEFDSLKQLKHSGW